MVLEEKVAHLLPYTPPDVSPDAPPHALPNVAPVAPSPDSQADASDSRCLYVQKLAHTIDGKALHATFCLFEETFACKVATDITGKSLGHGFVHYATEVAAKWAIERARGSPMGNRRAEAIVSAAIPIQSTPA